MVIKSCEKEYLRERAEEFLDVCHKAFAEHASRNLKMAPCNMSIEKWNEWCQSGLCQYMTDENDKIIGFWLCRINKTEKEAHGLILAVSPEYKRHGIGKKLSNSLLELLKSDGYVAFSTDTSWNAKHVIKFHKSYGCIPIGLTSYANTNYYSILFILPLTPEKNISKFKAKIIFWKSYIKCRLTYDANGKRTKFAKCYLKLKNSLK